MPAATATVIATATLPAGLSGFGPIGSLPARNLLAAIQLQTTGSPPLPAENLFLFAVTTPAALVTLDSRPFVNPGNSNANAAGAVAFDPGGNRVFALAANNGLRAYSLRTTVDTGFDPNANDAVLSIAVQPDAKLVMGGYFTTIGEVTRNFVARVVPDGSVDPGFIPNANNWVHCAAVQPDGTTVIGGFFTTLRAGVTRRYIGRVYADGTLDLNFNPNADREVLCLAVQADGNIVIGGSFMSLGGAARNRIARVAGTFGALDTGFSPDADDSVHALAVQADGKIVVGGAFTTIANEPRSRLARINPNGTLDMDFNPAVDGEVLTAAVQANGKILIGGSFTTVAGGARLNVARVNVDGTVDTSFSANTQGGSNARVTSLAVQTDGKIIVGGDFAVVRGQPRNYLARLHPDGSLDFDFNPDPNGIVLGMAMQEDGKIVLGGQFTRLGATMRNGIARLENDDATQSLTVPNASRVEWLRGGASPEAHSVVFQLSTNGGTNWTTVGAGTRISGGWEKMGLNLPSNSLVRARARINHDGRSSGLVQTVVAFPPALPPHLTNTLWLANGSFQFDFAGLSGTRFTALASSDLTMPSSNWLVLGPAAEIAPGQFRFTDSDARNFNYRFYQIRSP